MEEKTFLHPQNIGKESYRYKYILYIKIIKVFRLKSKVFK